MTEICHPFLRATSPQQVKVLEFEINSTIEAFPFISAQPHRCQK